MKTIIEWPLRLHWMIEEYEVSLFAQEVGTTDGPVLVKRLKVLIGEIEWMI